MTDIITISGLDKCFGQGENRIFALKNINLSIAKGDFVAIIGQSGSGKSTLMNILGCLDSPTSGSYKIHGTETGGMDSDQLAELRSTTFGFIFQRYNLLSNLSATENVALPSVYSGMDPAARRNRARQLLADLNMADKFRNRPNELSGGQQQRVSIARALMNGGEVILADEPTGALDSKSGEMVMGIIMDLHQKGHTIIVVTHDPNIAAYASRTIEIKDGVIISDTRKTDTMPAERVKPQTVKRNPMLYVLGMFTESFKMSVQAILSHKMRSLLTMLGIIIGIASVVSVVALGRGSQEKIMADINAMGTNTIDIMPGKNFGDMRSGRVKTLTVADADYLAQQSYIDSTTPNLSTGGTLVYGNVSVTAQMSGVGEKYFDVKGVTLEYGRLLSTADIKESAAVVVIDPNTRDRMFPNGENPIGQILIFNRKPLEIIGVARRLSSMGPGSSADNLNLWSPYTTVMHKITGARNISSITVKVTDEVKSQVAESNITRILTVRHGTKDFFTLNTDSIKQTIESTTGTMALLISCIAFISLVVGGIGVMNIMLVSVTERTREIGLRMAIGAKQINIMQQFLIEAVLICFIGGFIGVIVSGVVGVVFDMVAGGIMAMSFSMGSLILAITFSMAIGIIFGFLPARNAAQLNPIEALARE
ncbi:MacB family efflux pump subunit [Desulfosarcina sp. OttesenSCG-928-B08]|nr:MacB family efflux pump subunit [Desulfosarcina sp. OttesenSCG-928-B08]